MTDEASKLLRLVQEAEAWRGGGTRGNATLIDAAVQAIPALRAYLAALPAAAPPLVNEIRILELIAERLKDPVYAAAFMQAERESETAAPAPLPGPPRESYADDLREWLNSADGKAAIAIACSDADDAASELREARTVTPEQMNTPLGTTDQGASVIAPKPIDAGVQGQSTMQAGGDSGNTTKR